MVEEAEAAVERLVAGAGQPERGAEPGALLLLHIAAQRPREQAKQALGQVQAVVDRTWERLNAGHWSEIPVSHRQLYTLASLHKVRLLLLLRQPGDEASALRAALAAADMGLLMGSPLPGTAEGGGLTMAAAVLTAALQVQSEPEPELAPSPEPEPLPLPGGVRGKPVPVLERPSLERFLREHWTPQQPACLHGCLSHWPALHRWRDLGYLRRVAGARTVPVELGPYYTHPNWAQRLMTLDEFVLRHVQLPAAGPGTQGRGDGLGYLAQHPLLYQVPELRADIRVPEYCCLSDDPDAGLTSEPDMNAWFGPAGTVSPLHYDPKHNLLAQVVGSKRVLLYSPDLSARLYPHEGTLLTNTSQVDPELPDYERFPEYRGVPALECLLQAGDMLYIPPRWWHHVRALATSFSVSFWWE